MGVHLRYVRQLVRHKWFVFRGGLRTGVPVWRLLIHDWSKFSRAEWGPYARRFCGGRGGVADNASDPEEFHRAWTHHWHRSPHHWEHWLVIVGGSLVPVEMPEIFIREMVADWLGAGRGYAGSWDIRPWYERTAPVQILHPRSRERAEEIMEAAVRELTRGRVPGAGEDLS